ncbi:hypothetical protein MMC07_003508 [Pseudocyphellaria aurata]|nr:hypothetical protein [Pseudocyphellaria aurata]
MNAIDLSRYELPTTTTGAGGAPTTAALRQLQVAAAHLSGRLDALRLLEQHGRNAWLVGNATLEDQLRAYEEEIARVQAETEEVLRERKRVQEGARKPLEDGERAWKDAVEGLVRVGLGTTKAREAAARGRRGM